MKDIKKVMVIRKTRYIEKKNLGAISFIENFFILTVTIPKLDIFRKLITCSFRIYKLYMNLFGSF